MENKGLLVVVSGVVVVIASGVVIVGKAGVVSGDAELNLKLPNTSESRTTYVVTFSNPIIGLYG